MSRPSRAGEAGKPWACRITDSERADWERAAHVEGSASLSAWAVKTLNARAAKIISSHASLVTKLEAVKVAKARSLKAPAGLIKATRKVRGR